MFRPSTCDDFLQVEFTGALEEAGSVPFKVVEVEQQACLLPVIKQQTL
jgi:hypothetical protein